MSYKNNESASRFTDRETDKYVHSKNIMKLGAKSLQT